MSVISVTEAFATANYVYHERSTNNPGCGGQYVSNLNPSASDAVTVRFKVEYQYYTNTAKLYYTTDGSNPSGAFGTPSGTTQVINANWVCIFNAGQNVDVWEATIPAQQGGKTVKYIISAWHTGGGAEIFANSGEFFDPKTTSAQATQFSYNVSCPSFSFSPSSLASATQGSSYSQSITASGGTSPYSYAVTSGSLPAGIALTSTGTLSGTPTANGTFYFSVTATDANGCTGIKSCTLSVSEPPLTVKSISPSKNALNVSKATNITVVFNKPMNTGTLIPANIIVTGPLSGGHFGSLTLLGDTGFVFNPDKDFEDAENINVTLKNSIRASGGEYLTNGYHAQFFVQAQTGTGGFTLNNLYPINYSTQSITSGDWDGDGDIDLATPVSNDPDNRLYILYNDGTGHFFQQETLYVTSRIWRVKSGDIDNDGDLDIVADCNTANGAQASFFYTFLNNGSGQFSLSGFRITSVGGTPLTFDMSDIDGDGDLDIGVAAYDKVSFLKNDGNGNFTLYDVRSLAGNGNCPTFKFFDFDNDGDIDGVAGNDGDKIVRFFFNDGLGNYTQTSFELPGTHNFPSHVSAADLNGDGIGEVLVGGITYGYFAVLNNDGQGNFTFGQDLSAGGNSPLTIDVEGDGDLDIVPTISNYQVGVYKNNGTGSFPVFNTYGHGGADPFGFTYGDFDGDGDPDVATGNYSSPNVSVLFNEYGCPTIALDPPLSIPNSSENAAYSQTFTVTGSAEAFTFIISSGTLPPGLTLSSSGVLSGSTTTIGTYIFTVTALRGNGCSTSKTYTLVVGEPPIAVKSAMPAKNAINVNVSSDITIEFNKALNASSVTTSSFVVEGSYAGVYSGSISFPDSSTILFNPSTNFRVGEQISVLLAKSIRSASGDSLTAGYRFSFTVQAIGGTGFFTHTQNIATGGSSVGGTAADLDNDGDIDLIAGTSGLDSFTVAINNGSGGFSLNRIAGSLGEERHTIVGDFDRDGDLDFISSKQQGYNNNQIALYRNNGGGSFSSPIVSQMNGPASFLTAGDWDGDMDLDLAVYSPYYTQPRVVFLKNDGTGNFTEVLFITMTFGDYNYPGNIVNFDYDGDGDLDVLCGNGINSTIGVFVNDGIGNFSTSHLSPGNNPTYLYPADFDNDGDIDLAINHTVTYRWLEILKNNGYGVFTRTDSIYGSSTFSIAGLADVDGDGDIDFVAQDENNRFEVLKNNGTGSFTQTQSFLFNGLDGSVAGEFPVGDWDGDGDIDAATFNYSSPNVSILLNNFTCPSYTLSPSSLPNAIADSSYSQAVSASGGTSPYSYSLSSGSLPAGIALSSAGFLSGTPTTEGTSYFTISATDANGCTSAVACTLRVDPNPCAQTLDQQQLVTANGYSSIQNGWMDAQTFTPSQTGNFLHFALYLNQQNGYDGGILSAGDLIIELQSTVSTTANSFGGGCGTLTRYVPSGTVLRTLTVPSSTVALNTPQFYSFEFPSAIELTAGTVYALVLRNTGSAPIHDGSPGQYLWYQGRGSDATNLYTGGIAMAKRTTDATWNISEAVQPNSCNFTIYDDFAFKTYIGGCSTAPSCPTVTVQPSVLPNGRAYGMYSQTFTASGGAAPYTFAVTSGSLPSGLTLSSNGLLSGTIDAMGTSYFTITATDSNGCTGVRACTLNVPTECSWLSLSPTNLPFATIGEAYSQQLTASNGSGYYRFSHLSGSMPAGLTLDSMGLISGTPTETGSFLFVVQPVDSLGCFNAISCTLSVQEATNGSISGMKWNDENGNGLKDSSETGIPNWNIYLTGDRIDSTLTDANGNYTFGRLSAGHYTVSEEQRSGWTQTFPNTVSHACTLSAGQQLQNRNFGNKVTTEDPPPFTYDTPEILDGENEFCTPVIMNRQHTSSETWFVKAQGGDLGVTLYAHAVNNVDPESVFVQVYNTSNVLVSQFGVGYTAGEVSSGGIGFEKSIFVNIGGRSAGEILRFVVTTPPPTPSTQPHYRFHFGRVISAGINSPSFPGFEEEYARWYFNVGSGEDLNLDFFTTDMPTPADSVYVRVVEPGGAYHSSSGMYSVGAGTELNVSGASPGVWSVAIEHINGHYRLNKTTGSDKGIYVGQFSGGCGEKVVNVTVNGSPATGIPVNITLNQQVATPSGLQYIPKDSVITDSASFVFGKLATGFYKVDVHPVAPGYTTPASQFDTLFCDSTLINTFDMHPLGGRITGMKFEDKNGNGVKDPTDTAVPGWVITLDSEIRDTTDANGYYMFDNVATGIHTITEEDRAGWAQSSPETGEFTVTISGGDTSSGNNFGNYRYGSIGGFKWRDTDADGNYDGGEQKLPNWTIYLAGDFADTTTTDANGNYVFNNLRPGSYVLTEKMEAGWEQGYPGTGSHEVQLLSGQEVTGKNFGNLRNCSITCANDTTLYLSNSCFVSDVILTQPSVSGTCNVLSASNNAPFSFSRGTTVVQWELIVSGPETLRCNQTVTVLDTVKPTALAPANIAVNAEALLCGANVSFSVSATDNCPGVITTTSHTSGSLFGVGTTTVTVIATDSSGNADTTSFTVTVLDNVAPTVVCPANMNVAATSSSGAIVSFSVNATDNCPGAFVTTTPASGSLFPMGTTTVISIAQDSAGNADTCSFTVTVNAVASTISGKIFNDYNGNGTLDSGEPGLPNWVVFYTALSGGATDTTLTDGSGDYSFTVPDTGSYEVSEVQQPDEWVLTSSHPEVVHISYGQSVSGLNYGNSKLIVIGGKVFFDTNNNGAYDSETGLQGWVVSISTDDFETIWKYDTTDVNGLFSFEDVGPGTYRLREQLKSGWLQTTADPADVVVARDTNITNIYFGNVSVGSISGMKFLDFDGDSVKDMGEGGLANWGIVLQKDGTPVDTVFTDSTGAYNFTNLLSATYNVSEIAQTGWYQTMPGSGSYTLVVTGAAENYTNKDFGNFEYGSISGTKYWDRDSNAVKDATCESYLPGIKMVLIGTHTATDTVTTDASGSFTFTNVPADSFIVTEASNPEWKQTFPAHGAPYIVKMKSGLDTSGLLFGNFHMPDTTKFKTFLLSDYNKTARASQKSGFIRNPTPGNVRDTVFLRKGFGLDNPLDSGYLRIGIRRPDSALHYGWFFLRWQKYKGAAIKHWVYNMKAWGTKRDPKTKTQVPRNPAFYLTFVGEKYTETYFGNGGNHLTMELTTLKTNIAASDLGITPKGLGDLLYVCRDNTDDSIFVGKNIRQIIRYADTALTMGRVILGPADTVYRHPVSYLRTLDSVITRINREFWNNRTDTISSKPLRIKGSKGLYKVSYLMRDSLAPVPLTYFDANYTSEMAPAQYRLEQNYPNPFNPTTTIEFELQNAAKVTLKIFNVLGQEVATVMDNQELEAGIQFVDVDATNFATGVYFYRLEATSLNEHGQEQTFKSVKKMMLMK